MEQSDPRTPAGAAISELILTVFRLNGRFLAAGDRLVEEFGLTSARWQVLGAVVMHPTPETVARLARNMGLQRQGVNRIVNELAYEGFLEFRDNPHHRSAKLVVLTAKGNRALNASMRVQAPWVNELGKGLDAKTIKAAHNLLKDLQQRLERQAAAENAD
ncbi:MarR family winged helix-turn-helix transcriptional regulator [Lysobacter terrae]